MADLFKLVLAVLVVLFSATSTQAQKLPVPGQKNPDWSLQKTEEFQLSHSEQQPKPIPMPSPRLRGGMMDSAGNWEILYDSEHHVRYNLREQKRGWVRVQNLQTGTVYTYVRKGVVAPYFQN
ncbi:hypothetical protein [uncultured Hymenobacter sp.]|uniref:hypothetical protein n=1 Tax=uncultured Hymenobacter sp. TaxID=170016 RepID=UPI0035CC0D19